MMSRPGSRPSNLPFAEHGRNCKLATVSKRAAGCVEHSEAGGASSNNCTTSHTAPALFPFKIYLKNDACTAGPS
jgi:hypothetical protein